MNMSWDNYMMYLASIPTSGPDKKDDDPDTDQAPEEVSLFNLHD